MAKIDTHGVFMDLDSLRAAAAATRGRMASHENILQITFNRDTGKFTVFEHTNSESYVDTFTVCCTSNRITIQQLADVTAKAVKDREELEAGLAGWAEEIKNAGGI